MLEQFNNLLDQTGSLPVLNESLRPRGYQLAELTPPIGLLGENLNRVPDAQKENCRDFLISAVHTLRQRQFQQTGTPLHDEQVRAQLPGLVDKFLAGDTSLLVATAPGPVVNALLARNKNIKEQGISQFIALCTDSNVIMSSVDLYNNYRRWSEQNGYSCSSSPTLSKYLRNSDKKHRECLSEKSRSQGWQLATP